MIAVYALLAVIFAAVWTAVVFALGLRAIPTALAFLGIYAVAALLLGLAASGAELTTRVRRSR